jgi:hypothetical protein
MDGTNAPERAAKRAFHPLGRSARGHPASSSSVGRMSFVGHGLAGTRLRRGDACPTLEGAAEPADVGEAGKKSDLGDREASLSDEALDALAAHGIDDVVLC